VQGQPARLQHTREKGHKGEQDESKTVEHKDKTGNASRFPPRLFIFTEFRGTVNGRLAAGAAGVLCSR
jgi:hypothetical protein